MVLHWYVLRVRPGCEKSVVAALIRKGYEAFVPSHRCRRVWSDRLKLVEMPLFEGYVFCRLDISKRLPVMMTHNVLQFVSVGKTPVEIDDSKVTAIQAAMHAQVPVEPWPFEENGLRVRLQSGPLAGVEGSLIPAQGTSRMVVSLPILSKSIALEIQRDWLQAIESNGTLRNSGAAVMGDAD